MINKSYVAFGKVLKTIRLKAQESLGEVSLALETDKKLLTSLEAGKIQPSKDLVLMLISHFALKEAEAIRLWRLAGYSPTSPKTPRLLKRPKNIVQMAFISPNDAKIIYTDMVHVSGNHNGIVINFMQGIGGNSQPLTISRIGMSNEHAKSLIEVLQKTVNLTKKSPSQDKKSTE